MTMMHFENTVYREEKVHNEHFERWHGGKYQNDTSGVPNNLEFEEEF